MTSIDLTNTYLILGDRSTVDVVDGGAPFWQRLATDAELVARLDEARLVSAYRTDANWTNWERHPAGDEVIIATSGKFTVHTDDPASGARTTVELDGGQTIVMPSGVWHTVDVREPGTMLTLTAGRGTEHRDR